jgi:DNA-binding CsgD family transcriptional regulator/PAS domain-containing protein
MDRDAPTLEAIAQIYATILSPDNWPSAVASLATAFRADHALCMAGGRIGEADPSMSFGVGIDQSAFETLISPRAFALAEPWHRRIRPGRATSSAEIMTDREIMHTEIYNEFIKPVGGFHALTIYQNLPDAAFQIALCRPRKGGAFTMPEAAKLQHVLPHLASAFELRMRLAQSHHFANDLTALVDCLRDGVILVDAAGRPSFANSRAVELLDARDGRRCDLNGLAGASPAATQRLRDGLAAVLTRQAARNSAARKHAVTSQFSLPRTYGRLPLMIKIYPIGRLAADHRGLPPAHAAIFIRDPDSPLPVTGETLSDIFAFTLREAEIALEIARGRSVTQAAATLGMGSGTARQHLKRVYEKAGVHNRAALVALVRSCAGN